MLPPCLRCRSGPWRHVGSSSGSGRFFWRAARWRRKEPLALAASSPAAATVTAPREGERRRQRPLSAGEGPHRRARRQDASGEPRSPTSASHGARWCSPSTTAPSPERRRASSTRSTGPACARPSLVVGHHGALLKKKKKIPGSCGRWRRAAIPSAPTRTATRTSRAWPHGAALAEIAKGERAIAAALSGSGHGMAPFFRFPYLADTRALRSALAARGTVVLDVDIDSKDYFRTSSAKVLERTMARPQVARPRRRPLPRHPRPHRRECCPTSSRRSDGRATGSSTSCPAVPAPAPPPPP